MVKLFLFQALAIVVGATAGAAVGGVTGSALAGGCVSLVVTGSLSLAIGLWIGGKP